jgi:hypothetical protein
MEGERQTARSALKAAQAGLADGLTRLRVATAARGNGASGEEGEFVGTTGSGSPAQVGGPSLRGQLAQFLPGGLGMGITGGGMERSASGEHTILASDRSGVGSFQILHGFESRVDTPLTGDLRSSRSPSRGAFTSSFARLGGGALEDNNDSLGYDVNRGDTAIRCDGGGAGVTQRRLCP